MIGIVASTNVYPPSVGYIYQIYNTIRKVLVNAIINLFHEHIFLNQISEIINGQRQLLIL